MQGNVQVMLLHACSSMLGVFGVLQQMLVRWF